ncbi:PP2C family protein-serine/threonine phosphatase [Spirosoma jeollabukense]
MSSLLIAGQTDVGKRREDNQDTFICTTIWADTSALLVVIDGVGGYAGGDKAAAIAKESIERYMATPNGNPLSMLREAVVFANNQINEQRQQDPRLGQMCCVLTAALVDSIKHRLYYVHVGDTRLYRFRAGELAKLTQDHSMVGVREDANELSEAEAMRHPRRNEILREVGSTEHRVDDPDFLESGETDFLPGDQLLLCSDGLTDMITKAQIKAVLKRPIALEEQTAELIRVANDQGGKDNITVVLAQNTNQLTETASLESTALLPDNRTQQPAVATSPPAGSASAPTVPTPKKLSSTGPWIFLIVLLVGVVAGVVWYQSWPSGEPRLASDSLHTETGQADTVDLSIPDKLNSHLDSLVQVAHRSPDHRLVLSDDTLRIDQPLLLTDSLLAILGGNRLTVIVPRDTGNATVALRVDRRGAVSLTNLVIRGFKTGIETTGEARLQLNKVYFNQVGLPVRAAIRQDTCLNTVIAIAVQKQPVPTKPLRP